MTTKNYLKKLAFLFVFSFGILSLTSCDNQQKKQQIKQDLAFSTASVINSKTTNDKCGAGKKAKDSVKAKKNTKCGSGKCGDGKCGAAMKSKDSTHAKKAMKCGDGKCGTDKKAAKKAKKAKCGTGKCGGA